MLSDEKLNDAYEAAAMRGGSHADWLRGVAMAVVRAERDGAKKSFDIRCPACNGKGYGGEEDGCSNCSDTGFVTASLFIYNPEVGAEFWMAKAHQYDCERQELSAQLDAVLAEREGAEPVAWEFQHEETGLTDFVCPQQVEWGFEKNNPRWQKIGPVYRHPRQASATVPVVPVAFMREGWGPDCGPFVELYTADEMGSRDRDGWAALYTGKPAAPVPEGWNLVPVEPTERMLDHAVSFALNVGPAQSGGWTEYARRMWETMVIAAAIQLDGDKAQGVG